MERKYVRKIVWISVILDILAIGFLSSLGLAQYLHENNRQRVPSYFLGDSKMAEPDTFTNRLRDYFQRHKQDRLRETLHSSSSATYDSALTPVGEWAWGTCMGLDIQGNYAYIGNGRSFQILDITDINAPKIVGEYVTSATIYDVRLKGDSVAFVCNWDGFLIFDVSNPTAPQKLSELSLWGGNRVIPADSFAYVASGGILSIVDITDLRNPYIRSQAAGDFGEGDPDEMAIYDNRYIYLGDSGWRYAIFAYDCSDPDNLRELPDINIYWNSFAVCENQPRLLVGTDWLKDYILVDPANPALIESVSVGSNISVLTVTHRTSGTPSDLVITGGYNGWLHTVGIDSFPALVLDSIYVPQIVNQYITSVVESQGKIGIAADIWAEFASDQNPYGLQSGSGLLTAGLGPVDVAVQGNYAYLANGGAGFAILDISNPTHPIRAGALHFDGVDITAVAVQGSYAYVVGGYGHGFWTVDVSNPHAPKQTGFLPIAGSSQWHPGLAIDNNRAYVALDNSGVVAIDISNPAAPSGLATYPQPALNLAARDSLLFLSGMSILNVSDPQHITQVSQLNIPSFAIAVDSTFAYNGGIADTGLTVVDISNPSQPAVLSTIGMWLNGSNIIDMALSGRYLYLSGNYIIYALDVSNPHLVQIVGSCSPISSLGVAARDRFVYLSEGLDGLQIFENELVHISHQQPYSFNAGWNMISIASLPNGNRTVLKDTLFPSSISSAFTYETGYVVEDTLRLGTGYWLKFDSAQNLLLPDVPVYSESIVVVKGWNMIGSISIPISVSHIGSNPPNIGTSQFFGLSGSAGYEIADTIEPGKGYWVRVNQPATLILPTEIPSGKAVPSGRLRIIPTSERPPSPPVSGMGDHHPIVPQSFALEQNYPNPFNPTTFFKFQLPVETHAEMKIYDVLGQEVATLVDEMKKPGKYTVRWEPQNVSSGVYYCVLSTSAGRLTRRLLLIK